MNIRNSRHIKIGRSLSMHTSMSNALARRFSSTLSSLGRVKLEESLLNRWLLTGQHNASHILHSWSAIPPISICSRIVWCHINRILFPLQLVRMPSDQCPAWHKERRGILHQIQKSMQHQYQSHQHRHEKMAITHACILPHSAAGPLHHLYCQINGSIQRRSMHLFDNMNPVAALRIPSELIFCQLSRNCSTFSPANQ